MLWPLAQKMPPKSMDHAQEFPKNFRRLRRWLATVDHSWPTPPLEGWVQSQNPVCLSSKTSHSPKHLCGSDLQRSKNTTMYNISRSKAATGVGQCLLAFEPHHLPQRHELHAVAGAGSCEPIPHRYPVLSPPAAALSASLAGGGGTLATSEGWKASHGFLHAPVFLCFFLLPHGRGGYHTGPKKVNGCIFRLGALTGYGAFRLRKLPDPAQRQITDLKTTPGSWSTTSWSHHSK